ncbi:hypothetical protein DFJ58DRAFT_760886 [Suillus subalutaceus]|uniref:uncharacterized protein n=1 Tax=Suillus subalutaceus TaxID=48586 RepID=UPI001B878A18|nr:uncharacterized protein DFJ58DRAFT_760886 [Suillus subalutaceus]KAG1873048.1 hypothetical protein DFJ58DRAFT_760886 [Suillus subalutaceus]
MFSPIIGSVFWVLLKCKLIHAVACNRVCHLLTHATFSIAPMAFGACKTADVPATPTHSFSIKSSIGRSTAVTDHVDVPDNSGRCFTLQIGLSSQCCLAMLHSKAPTTIAKFNEMVGIIVSPRQSFKALLTNEYNRLM